MSEDREEEALKLCVLLATLGELCWVEPPPEAVRHALEQMARRLGRAAGG